MLLELRVRGLGIIDEITWEPAAGLQVITGETGAGKSLVVDAIEALLAGRVEEEAIRPGLDEAQVEGVFAIPRGDSAAALLELLESHGLSKEQDNVILTCDFRRQGRTVIRVNRQAVSRGLLQAIGGYLVDIHGQSEHLSLLSREQQLRFLDCYAHTTDLQRRFAAEVLRLSDTNREIRKLAGDEQEFSRKLEFLRFQIDEIKQAELKDGEEDELDRERTLLESAEKLKSASFEVYEMICGDDNTGDAESALNRLSRAVAALKQVVEKDPALGERFNFLEGAVYGLEDMAHDVRAYGEKLEYDPQRLEEIAGRLELIRGLKRKYGNSIAEVLVYLEKAEAEFSGLTHSSERRIQLEGERGKLIEEMGALAFKLSQARGLAAEKLAAAVQTELKDINMSQVDFSVSISQEPSPDGVPFPDGKTYAFNASGADTVEFMVATNPGEPLKPLARIASTGEMSRFMLALKGALAEADTIPVLIFDEIDIGVGGRSGEVIGRKLWNIAKNRQVICVTHLPQIAAFADAHYHVHKEIVGERALSSIGTLGDSAQVDELAAMLAGSHYTEATVSTARELINKARRFKHAPS